MTPFQASIKFVLDHEGGWVNNPNDPGGETKYGISKRQYPDVDIKNLSVADAMVLYQRDYWDAHQLDGRPFPYSVGLFDSYVQHRPEKVLAWDNQAAGDIRAFLELRRSFYLRLIEINPSMRVFQRGWLARIGDLSKYVTILQQDLSSEEASSS